MDLPQRCIICHRLENETKLEKENDIFRLVCKCGVMGYKGSNKQEALENWRIRNHAIPSK